MSFAEVYLKLFEHVTNRITQQIVLLLFEDGYVKDNFQRSYIYTNIFYIEFILYNTSTSCYYHTTATATAVAITIAAIFYYLLTQPTRQTNT